MTTGSPGPDRGRTRRLDAGADNPQGATGHPPDSSGRQVDYVFHELHADGRHALCAVCGSDTGLPALAG